MQIDHYKKAAVTINLEPWYLCERLPFNLGCAVKYICRAKHKGQEASDIEKALAYLRRCAQSYVKADGGLPRHEWLGATPDHLDAFRRQYPELEILFDDDGDVSVAALSHTMQALTRRLGELEREGKI